MRRAEAADAPRWTPDRGLQAAGTGPQGPGWEGRRRTAPPHHPSIQYPVGLQTVPVPRGFGEAPRPPCGGVRSRIARVPLYTKFNCLSRLTLLLAPVGPDCLLSY
jgi:hypothetical protein